MGHPVIENSRTLSFGERCADRVKAALGSWKFIWIQTGVVFVWVVWNSVSGKAFDPYPWILLNLLFSTQAAYAAPILQLSSNRGDRIQEELANHDHRMLSEVHEMLSRLSGRQDDTTEK